MSVRGANESSVTEQVTQRPRRYHAGLDRGIRKIPRCWKSFGELPASCLELRTSIVSESDPRVELVNGVIESKIEFGFESASNVTNVVTKHKNKSIHFVDRTSLIDVICACDLGGVVKKVKKSVLKDIVDAAMAVHGRPLEDRMKIDGQDFYNVYKDCSWKEG